jgi:hypothetical protein
MTDDDVRMTIVDQIREALDAVANALQPATLLAGRLRRELGEQGADRSRSRGGNRPRAPRAEAAASEGGERAMNTANKKQGYSTEPRPEVVETAKKFEGTGRRELMKARDEAVARGDWLAMQAITYVLTTTVEGKLP